MMNGWMLMMFVESFFDVGKCFAVVCCIVLLLVLNLIWLSASFLLISLCSFTLSASILHVC